MKLKKKLALSFAILFMLPTLTVTFFLFTRIFRIVLNDTLRSEEVFHSCLLYTSPSPRDTR